MNESLEEHVVCFKNSWECFFNRLPALTCIVTFVVLWSIFALIGGTHLPPLEPSRTGVEEAPWFAVWFVFGFIGAVEVIGTWFVIWLGIPYVWSEIKDIPGTISQCLKCKK